jgi:hypothetical protein
MREDENMQKQHLFTVMLFCIALGTAWAQNDQVCRVEKISIATSVELKEPVGVATEFDASVVKVNCWMRIACADIPKEVKHIWYLENEKQLEVPLTVKFPSMRTWSTKNIRPGTWRVEVVDESGAILGQTTFTVK